MANINFCWFVNVMQKGVCVKDLGADIGAEVGAGVGAAIEAGVIICKACSR